MIEPKMPLSGATFECFCPGGEHTFFKTQAHLLVFAASLGCEHGIYTEEYETKSDSIKESVLRNQELLDRIRIMALVKEKDPKVLDDDSNVARIIEGYAAAGFKIMESWLEEAEDPTFFFDFCKNEVLKRSDTVQDKEDF